MKELRCRDSGADCDFVARAEIGEDLLRQAAEHARKDHGMTEITEEFKAKIRGLIRDV